MSAFHLPRMPLHFVMTGSAYTRHQRRFAPLLALCLIRSIKVRRRLYAIQLTLYRYAVHAPAARRALLAAIAAALMISPRDAACRARCFRPAIRPAGARQLHASRTGAAGPASSKHLRGARLASRRMGPLFDCLMPPAPAMGSAALLREEDIFSPRACDGRAASSYYYFRR